jgi:hypothetical protein
MLYEGGQMQLGVIAAQATIGPAPAPAPSQFTGAAVKSIGRTKTGVTEAPRTGDICDSAMSALGRQSPAAPNLVTQCYAARIAKIGQGVYLPSNAFSPDDPAYRVALTNAGEKIVQASPALQALRSRLPADPDGDTRQARGFTMAQGVRAGLVDPGFIAWVRAGLARSPGLLKGFDDAINAPADFEITQGTQGPSSASSEESGGIPRAVIIGGAAIGVLAAVALAYKLTR